MINSSETCGRGFSGAACAGASGRLVDVGSGPFALLSLTRPTLSWAFDDPRRAAGATVVLDPLTVDDLDMKNQRTVIVLPGRSYGAYVPQLFFPMTAAQRRGARVQAVSWQQIDALDKLALDEISGWVADQVGPLLADHDPESTLVIGKSLGSYAAPLVAEHGFPAIWVTPVLISAEVVGGIEASSAPCLLAGGAADPLWDASLAFRLSDRVVEIADGDHGLMVPHELARSAEAMGKLATASERFLDSIGWTPTEDPSPAAHH